MILKIIFLIFSFHAEAQVSLCSQYDVVKTPPKELLIEFETHCMKQGDVLYIDGMINSSLLDEITSHSTIKKIFLNSTGGQATVAIQIAKWIRNHNIETILRKDAVCMSACTLLFQSGVKRIAHKSAIFMYHGVRLANMPESFIESIKNCIDFPKTDCMKFIENNTLKLQEITNQIFDLYILYGADQSIYTDYFSLEEDSNWIDHGNYLKIKDWYMNPDQALSYNIVTEISLKNCNSGEYCY